MVGLAYVRYRTGVSGWSTAEEDKPVAQMELLTKATAINPEYAFDYYVKSLLLWLAKQYPEAIEAAQTAVTLDPNAAYGYAAIGQAEFKLGRCEQSMGHIKQAVGLSPRDPLSGVWHMMLGLAEECLGRRDAAIVEFKRAIDAGYRPFIPYALLAGLEAAKGN